LSEAEGVVEWEGSAAKARSSFLTAAAIPIINHLYGRPLSSILLSDFFHILKNPGKSINILHFRFGLIVKEVDVSPWDNNRP
jgi:hypothetical protein